VLDVRSLDQAQIDLETYIADLEEKWVIEPEKFVSKGKNNPFGGTELFGAVKYTIVDGEIKYQA
jgi:dihydroorotase